MLQIKPLSSESISGALSKAKHYRLLNEPWQAESICRDILDVDPSNQDAILVLILAITDQFESRNKLSDSEAKKLCAQLNNEYQQEYYRGLVAERMGKAALKRKSPRVNYIAYEYYRYALDCFEKAEKLQTEENQESVLRWNACVRAIQEYNLKPSPNEDSRQPFLDV